MIECGNEPVFCSTRRPQGHRNRPRINSQVPRYGQPIRRKLTFLITHSFRVYVVRISHASGTRLLSEQVQNFHNSLGSMAKRFSDLGPITTTSRRVKLVPRTSRKSLKANVFRFISFSHFHGFLHNFSMLLILLISRFHNQSMFLIRPITWFFIIIELVHRFLTR